MAKVLISSPIDHTNLVSCSIPETDYAVWDPLTNYHVGDYCIKPDTHRIYLCLVDNIAKDPATHLTGTTPEWYDEKPTNRYACLDDKISTLTTAVGGFNYVIDLSVYHTITGISVMGVHAQKVRAYIVYGGVIKWDETVILDGRYIYDYYDYFFLQRRTQMDVIFTGVYPAEGILHIEVTDLAANIASVGAIKIGRLYNIGTCQYGAIFGITSYSLKSRDEWGVETFVKRGNSKHMSFPLQWENDKIGYYYGILRDLESVPAVYIGYDDNFAGNVLVGLGFYKDFQVTIPYKTVSTVTLEIEGLT